MLRRGLADFECIVPGFKEGLLAAGAVNINFLMDTCGVRAKARLSLTVLRPIDELQNDVLCA